MLNLEIYTLSLDILVETIINHQKLHDSHPIINTICDTYDNFYETNKLNDLLNLKKEFYKKQLLKDDDSLFISDTHIPYIVKKSILISEKEKILVYITIQNWITSFNIPNQEIYKKLAQTLGIETNVANETESFLSNQTTIQASPNYLIIKPEILGKDEILEGEWVEGNKPKELIFEEQNVSTKVDTPLHVLFVKTAKFFITKFDEERIVISKNDEIQPDNCCIIQSGDTISINGKGKIGFAELKKKLVEKHFRNNFYLSASRVELSYKNNIGIKAFNFIGQPGELIGVIGREGSGKSTVLKLLSGNESPSSGSIYVNGYNLFKNQYQLNGFIGYVPEEDLLYPELSSFENLNIAAQLYLSKMNNSGSKIIVDSLLKEMDLWEIRDITVGTVQDKNVQPGQRRLLNIGLELIRDPQILIVDNSPSSLSMSDSSKVLEVLNRYTFKGKLIITSIVQTDNSSFEYFDNLFILDEGGIPIYFGPRYNALHYLLCFLPEGISRNYLNEEKFTPDLLLDLLHKRAPLSNHNRFGERYINSLKLYEYFIDQPNSTITSSRKRKKIPGKQAHPPRLEKQFLIYFIRNFKTKMSRKRDLTFSIFATPFIAFILAIILRSSGDEAYNYHNNPNIASFFYISIIVNVFMGLAQSIREIIREKFVLKKEESLNLSLFSYINSKISYLFLILVIQSFLYALIANSILEIHGMLHFHWIIYFTCGASGVLLGLIFSSTHKNYDSIFLKSIPVTIIILVLLGGGWIPLKNITFTNDRYTPFISDLSISRWAFESIMVQQYKANPYEKKLYDIDRKISIGTFNSYHMLPKLAQNIVEISEVISSKDQVIQDSISSLLAALKNRFIIYTQNEDIFAFEFIDSLNITSFNPKIASETLEFISYLDYYFYNKYNAALNRKNKIIDSLNGLTEQMEHQNFRSKYVNKHISEIVRNTSQRESLKLINDHWVQISDPIFQMAENNFGRTQFYFPEKRFNNQPISTFEFNLSILWLFNFLFYILLITNVINRLKSVFRI